MYNFPYKEGDLFICKKSIARHYMIKGNKCKIVGVNIVDGGTYLSGVYVEDSQYNGNGDMALYFHLSPESDYYFFDYFISLFEYRKNKLIEILK